MSPSNIPYCPTCGNNRYSTDYRCSSCGSRILHGTPEEARKAKQEAKRRVRP